MSKHIVTLGNPNSGKTTLFNAMTGSRQRVGNFSGVTVDKKVGQIRGRKWQAELVDLPGVYNIDPLQSAGAVDELITVQYLLEQKPDLIINVVDATSLERNLYLTLQMKELGLPVLLVLNKMDTPAARSLNFDLESLSQQLDLPVVALSANNRRQVQDLVDGLPDLLHQAQQGRALCPRLPEALDQFCQEWSPALEHTPGRAIRLLELEPMQLQALTQEQQTRVTRQVEQLQAMDIDLQLADSRYSLIYQVTQASVRNRGSLSRNLSEQLDRVLLNRWLGIPLFLGMMYLMFMFAINGGAVFIDFFDILAGTLFVDGIHSLLASVNAPDWLGAILADGIGTGIQTVATFIPVIAFLYLFLALLESSGYLARAAVVVDKLMQKLGLPGKAFVPMLMGFGCTVPAVMATRVLEQQRERILTSAMSPFMSCGARLPVYALFAAAFFPSGAQNLVFGLYLLGILAAMGTGLMLKKTLLPGESKESLLELPDYQMPTLNGVLLLTWQKTRGFVTGAGKTIVLVVALLSVLNSLGTDGSFGNADSETSVLSKASQAVTPVFHPMGIEQENWQATVGIITGIFAKEAVVGTLNSLYSGGVEADEDWSLVERIGEAGGSILDNLAGLDFSDPLGIAVDEDLALDQAAEANEVEISTLAKLQQAFTSSTAAFAYLVFILMYMPCAAAMGALVKELGAGWARLIAVWSTLLAYCSAVLVYQASLLASTPLTALPVMLMALAALAGFVWLLKQQGHRLYDPATA